MRHGCLISTLLESNAFCEIVQTCVARSPAVDVRPASSNVPLEVLEWFGSLLARISAVKPAVASGPKGKLDHL